MKNLVIFGGGFDPIHNGHLNMAINASDVLNAEVFFVPARVSVWKETSGATAMQKIEMINLAIKELGKEDRLFTSDYEANSDRDINYSIDTVKYFRDKFPEKELFLLIGTDQVNSFDKWKEAEQIASIAHIVFFPRPGYELDKNMIDRFKMQQINGNTIEESSTNIKALKSLKIPFAVASYIIDNNLYFMKKIKTYMSDKRYLHSISVAKLSAEIAISNGIKEWGKFLRAGLLHDIAKELPMKEQKTLMQEHYSRYQDFPPAIYHQFLGGYLAKKDFGLTNAEEIEAIEYHTTGKKEMTVLGKVIYAADKIEPTRGFDSSEMVKTMKVNIEEGFRFVLSENRKYFVVKEIQFDNPLTAECMDYYLNS